MPKHAIPPTLTDMAEETHGARIKRRRLALGMSLRELAREAEISRATLAEVEQDSPTVRETSLGKLDSTLGRLEAMIGMDVPDLANVTNTIELPDGTRVTFSGPAAGVAEAAIKFLSERAIEPASESNGDSPKGQK